MNNFTTTQASEDSTAIPKHLEQLTTSVFQSLFPPISPQTTPLTSIRRVLLLNRELDQSGSKNGGYVINLRHFAITTKRVGLSKGIRRLNAAEKLGSREKRKKGIPNLGRLDDVADYLLGPAADGYTSASETEVETDAEIEVLESSTRKVLTPKQRAQRRAKAAEDATSQAQERSNVEKRAVKLIELGPRMRLRLMKVEEGVCTGKVMWHEYVHKTAAEAQELDQVWETRRKEKERRKAEQRANVERKKSQGQSGGDQAEDDMMDDDDEWDSEGLEGDGELEAAEDTEMPLNELHEVPTS
jgi:ribosome biogenesis protein SSF1/2